MNNLKTYGFEQLIAELIVYVFQFIDRDLGPMNGDIHGLSAFFSCPMQIHREFRKPLVVMAPKNLLRHPRCKSNLSEFDDVQGHAGFDKQGTRFKRLIKDQNDHSDLEEGIRRLVLCSGKVGAPSLENQLRCFFLFRMIIVNNIFFSAGVL